MKGIILYESKSGATAAYAHWLGESTGFPVVPARKAGSLEAYDLVVLGTCIRAWRPTLAPWITARWKTLAGRNPVLFTVAGALAQDTKRQDWVDTALGPIARELPHFPLDGKMVLADMGWFERTMMGMVAKMMAKKNPEESAEMLKEFNRVDEANLGQLKAWLADKGVALAG